MLTMVHPIALGQFFLGEKLVPRIPRDSDHLERCSIAYSNQWKKRRIYKENFSRGWYRSKVMTHYRIRSKIGIMVPIYMLDTSIDGKSSK